MSRTIRITAVCIVLYAMSLFGVTAQAADPNFCSQYAQAAINQVRGGLANPGCADSMRGARWSSDFHVHYNWCLGVSYAAANAERDIRTGYLQGCRH